MLSPRSMTNFGAPRFSRANRGNCVIFSASLRAATRSTASSASRTAASSNGAFSSSPISIPINGKHHPQPKKKRPMPKPKKPGIIESVLANPALPIERRLELLATLAANPGQENKAILAAILELLTASQGPELYAQKLAELNELIKQLQDGPLR